MMTTKQAAERLGLSVRRVQALVQAGQLEARRIGRDWLIEDVSVDRRLMVQEAQRAWSILGIPRRLWGAWWLADMGEVSTTLCPECGGLAYSPGGGTKYSGREACPSCGWKDEGSESLD